MSCTKRLAAFVLLLSLAGCSKTNLFEPKTVAPSTLRDVPSLRLSFRYEGDVPAPATPADPNAAEEKNPAVQADFDNNRPTEVLDRTIASPDKKRWLAIYQRAGDKENTFRADMYGENGRFIRRVSPESMIVDFPDIVVWSPDSQTVAFVGITREGSSLTAPAPNANANTNANAAVPKPSSDANLDANANANTEPTPAAAAPPTVGEAAPEVVTFRTEQIYLCTSEGTDLRPVTQSEGKIYYYFVWSPDSRMLAALAATAVEWSRLENMARMSGEKMVPLGRPRVVEKNGRERLLDDNLTAVHPVWSPDSAKVAVGFVKDQIRIYDAIGDQPTQAAIPVRNALLFSSQAYDRKVNEEAAAAPDANANAAPNANVAQQSSTLPDEKTLVSFQPITTLQWPTETELYFQTGFVKDYVSGDSPRSSLRWHRLILSPQATVVK